MINKSMHQQALLSLLEQYKKSYGSGGGDFYHKFINTTDQLEYECDVTKEVFLLLQTDAQAREEFLQSMKADGLKPVDKSKQALDEKHAEVDKSKQALDEKHVEENDQLPKTWARKRNGIRLSLSVWRKMRSSGRAKSIREYGTILQQK
ncbi:uncharacterized protein LOC134270268 [Saccostrea cucullata]|uniref:uncharacterized protein LOC134270268 n=1 Tax=Saccostrea cuccullata TaxID=36930 RepID=UPI002ED59E01